MDAAMPQPAPAERGLSRTQFEARLAASGILLSPEERDSVFGIASWLSAGVAPLDRGVPRGPKPSVDAADLSIVEAGRRLREGTLCSLDLTRAVLERIA